MKCSNSRRVPRSEKRRPRLRLENLEPRELLTVETTPIQAPASLTVSFVPDGTDVAGNPSILFQSLDSQEIIFDWQTEILRGFQTWAVETNVNFGVILDDGSPLGTPGAARGDARFGDVRIVGLPLSDDVIAVSIPTDRFVSGTWAGDVVINTTYDFSHNSSDLFAVIVHEAGHVLGLEHSGDPTSVMSAHGIPQAAELSATDTTNIRLLYGERGPDSNEDNHGNDSFDRATRVKYSSSFHGETPLMSFGDITTTDDVDIFEARPIEEYEGAMTFELKTSTRSLLDASMSLFDEDHNLISTGIAGANGNITISLDDVEPDQKYFVRVKGSEDGLTGIGSYVLITSFDETNTVDAQIVDEVLRLPIEDLKWDEIRDVFLHPAQLINDEEGEDDSFLLSHSLKPSVEFEAANIFRASGSTQSSLDNDFYRIKSPDSETKHVLNISLWSNTTALNVGIVVYDGNEEPLKPKILARGNGVFNLQIDEIKNGSSYYVAVEGSDVGSTNYAIDMNFDSSVTNLTQYSEGVIDNVQPDEYDLYVANTQLFHLLLTSVGTGTEVPGEVTLSIINEAGEELLELRSGPFGMRSDQILLKPGAYRVRISAAGLKTRYVVSGLDLDKPIGPLLEDPTALPLYKCQPTRVSTLYCYPGEVISSSPYVWSWVDPAKQNIGGHQS